MSTVKSRLSSRLSSFFDWHRRKKPSPPGGAAQPAAQAESVQALQQHATEHEHEPAANKPAKRDKGYNEVLHLLEDVRQHMKDQANRSERLLQTMEGLPEALRNLPETNRNQVRILEAIEGHLDQQSQNQGNLTSAMNGLAKTTEAQEQNIGIIKEHLGRQEKTDQQMLTSFSSLTNTLGKLNESSQASAASLQQLSERGENREHEMRDLFKRNQKHMAAMSAVSWSLALIALAVAGYVAVSITQLPTGQATPAGNSATPMATAGLDGDAPDSAAARNEVGQAEQAASATPEPTAVGDEPATTDASTEQSATSGTSEQSAIDSSASSSNATNRAPTFDDPALWQNETLTPQAPAAQSSFLAEPLADQSGSFVRSEKPHASR
jgi:hypothetical protein